MPEVRPQKRLREHVARRPAAVAGASAGIGAEIARHLAAAGYPVALGARRADRLEHLVDEITAAGGEAAAFPLDVADTASVNAFAKSAVDHFGEIDIVIANASTMPPGVVVDTTPDTLQHTLNTNVVGLQRLIAAFVPAMVERERGDLVVISSDVVDHARPFVGAYVSSKWAIEGLTRTLQMELEGTGVRASIVRPGPTSSEISAGWEMADALKALEYGQKFGGLRHYGYLHPSGVAQTVAHVVSAPRGTHIALSHVTPEAPLPKRTEDES